MRIAIGSLLIAALGGLAWIEYWGAAGGALPPLVQELLRAGLISGLALGLVGCAAGVELTGLLALRGLVVSRVAACGAVAVCVGATWLAGWANIRYAAPVSPEGGLVAGVLVVLLVLAGAVVLRGSSQAMEWLAGVAAAVVYLGVPLSLGLALRLGDPGARGLATLLGVIAITKAGDIGAYFGGVLFGRHRGVTRLSPNKSLEGFAGAVVCSAAAGWAWAVWDPGLTWWLPGGGPARLGAAGLGAVIGLLGIVGDLLESALKRSVSVKDSSGLIPAFGGALDVLDSLLVCLPVGWLVLGAWGR